MLLKVLKGSWKFEKKWMEFLPPYGTHLHIPRLSSSTFLQSPFYYQQRNSDGLFPIDVNCSSPISESILHLCATVLHQRILQVCRRAQRAAWHNCSEVQFMFLHLMFLSPVWHPGLGEGGFKSTPPSPPSPLKARTSDFAPTPKVWTQKFQPSLHQNINARFQGLKGAQICNYWQFLEKLNAYGWHCWGRKNVQPSRAILCFAI